MSTNFDNTWDTFDRLVESYAAASQYVSELRELEHRLAHVAGVLARTSLTYADFSALLTGKQRFADETVRKTAWAAQHIFNRRAFGIGQRALLKRGTNNFASPLLGQLEILGFRTHLGAYQGGANQYDDNAAQPAQQLVLPASEKLDAILPSLKDNRVILVKGLAYSAARRISPNLVVNADKQSLYGKSLFAGSRFISGAHMPATSALALLAVRDFIRTVLPTTKVHAYVMLINDPDCSWHFQLHDLSATPLDALTDSGLALDNHPVESDFRAFPAHFNKDADEFATLPEWAVDDIAAVLPVDRPARSLMLLSELWSRQCESPDRLLLVPITELASGVYDRYGIVYPKDQIRHDLEDCLERNAFVRRGHEQGNAVAITPKGVARLLMIRAKYTGGKNEKVSAVLEQVTQLSKLWAAAPVV